MRIVRDSLLAPLQALAPAPSISPLLVPARVVPGPIVRAADEEEEDEEDGGEVLPQPAAEPIETTDDFDEDDFDDEFDDDFEEEFDDGLDEDSGDDAADDDDEEDLDDVEFDDD